MAESNRRFRLRTLAVAFIILALACIFAWRQRKLERLRAALVAYKGFAHQRVVAKLNNSAPKLDWPDETSLGDVIQHINLDIQTSWPIFPLGVPVAVDPAGMEAAGRTLRSPVRRPPLDPELSLGQKLEAVLKPLGLACQVKDATIVITAERMVDEGIEDQDDVEPSAPTKDQH